MKRRKILGSIGLMGIPGLGQASSLYGTPVSVTGPTVRSSEPLKLLLSDINVPASLVPVLNAYGSVFERVLGNEPERQRFQRDPAGFLAASGIPASMLDARDQEVMLLRALADTTVLGAAVSGNYKDFVDRLRQMGVTSQTSKSEMKKQVLAVLRNNLAEIKQKIAVAGTARGNAAVPPEFANSSELTFLYGQLAPSIEQVAVAAVPVAIAAIVVAYVSVVTAVTIAILAGVAISIAVAMAVVASGGPSCSMYDIDTQYAGPAEMPRARYRSLKLREMQHALAQRELVGKRMLMLSPERLADAQRSARLARLMNKDAFVLESNRQLVKDEISIFIEAAEEVGLITIPKDTREEVMSNIHTIALRAAALEAA